MLLNAFGAWGRGLDGGGIRVFCNLHWSSKPWVHGQGPLLPRPKGSAGREFIIFSPLCSTQPRRKDALSLPQISKTCVLT